MEGTQTPQYMGPNNTPLPCTLWSWFSTMPECGSGESSSCHRDPLIGPWSLATGFCRRTILTSIIGLPAVEDQTECSSTPPWAQLTPYIKDIDGSWGRRQLCLQRFPLQGGVSYGNLPGLIPDDTCFLKHLESHRWKTDKSWILLLQICIGMSDKRMSFSCLCQQFLFIQETFLRGRGHNSTNQDIQHNLHFSTLLPLKIIIFKCY